MHLHHYLPLLILPLLSDAFLTPSRLDSRLHIPSFAGSLSHRRSSRSVDIFTQANTRVNMCVRSEKHNPLYGWLSDLDHMKKILQALPIIAIVFTAAFACPESSSAVLSNEQRVVAEAWSVVDSTFVDRTFNDNDWMNIRQKLVKREYKSREEVRAALVSENLFLKLFHSLVYLNQAYQVISEEMLKKLGDKYTRFITPTKYEALRNSILGVKGEDVSGTRSAYYIHTTWLSPNGCERFTP
jgi:hypothetical protein